jgi:hypothetical protein
VTGNFKETIMQAIQTKYLCPTNSKGSRIKATCAAGSVTINYPHELSGMDCHAKAAYALLAKMHWDYKLVGGQLADQSYAFVMVDPLSNV